MSKYLRELKIASIIVMGGMLIPALLSIVFSGFRVDIISIVNYEFFTGLIISLIGGVIIISDFFRFRKKVLKTPMDSEVEEEEKIFSEGNPINWAYLLFYAGITVSLAAIGVGEIF